MEGENLQPELYFLILKFLQDSPCQDAFNVLRTEIEKNVLLPKKLNWLGEKCPNTFEELVKKYAHLRPDHLLEVCRKSAASTSVNNSLRLVPSLLGVDNYSVARNNKPVEKRHFSLQEYAIRQHGLPLLEPVTFCNHNIVKALYGFEVKGSINRNHLFAGRPYKNIQLMGQTLGHLSAVYCVLFDTSSRYIFTGADDLLVKIWHAVSGRLLKTLRGASAEITDIAVNYENTLLAAGSVDKVVRIWCLLTAYPVATLLIHTGLITSVNFCPTVVNGCRYLTSTATDGSVAFWKYATTERTNVRPQTTFEQVPVQYFEKLRPGCAQILCGSFSSGGMFLATGSADHNVRVYKMAGPEGPHRVLEKSVHTDRVDSIQWANTRLKFVSGSKDGTALIWYYSHQEWKTLALVMSTKLSWMKVSEDDSKKVPRVTMLSWDKSDQWVITSSSDNVLRIWDSVSGQLVQALLGHKSDTYIVESHPLDSKILLSAGHDGKIFLWNILSGEMIASFQNNIEGQGVGAVFDAKWSPDGSMFTATDSHGQILTFGFVASEERKGIPREMFFHTDYRPLTRGPNNRVLDEQTNVEPHLMPAPFLVDMDGNPYPPYLQRLVPGREHCSIDHLVPNMILGDEGRQEIYQEITPPDSGELAGPSNVRSNNTWRHTGGDRTSWRGSAPEISEDTPRRVCQPTPKYLVAQKVAKIEFLGSLELEEYRRESKKPILVELEPISDVVMGGRRISNRRRRRIHNYRTRASRTEQLEMEFEDPVNLASQSSSSDDDENEYTAPDSDQEVSSGGDESSTDYSDWTAESSVNRLEPPKRTPARVKVRQSRRKRDRDVGRSKKEKNLTSIKTVAEEYQPPEWLCEVLPKKTPYFPQMGDMVMFFQQGYNLYLNAVQNKNVYKVKQCQLNPWGKIKLKEPQLVKVIGIKYEIRPPRLCGLRLAVMDEQQPSNEQHNQPSFNLKYHDVSDVIDFLVLKNMYDASMAREWKVGDRFRSVIDDAWWFGKISSRNNNAQSPFLCYRILWDNGESESLSPWDMEPLNNGRRPQQGKGSMPILDREREAFLYKPDASDWPTGSQDVTCDRILRSLEDLMSMSLAEAFLVPVNYDLYPSYPYIVDYPVDLSLIKARLENRFYRRLTAVQFDARYIASNAEKFNEPRSVIVKNARIVTEILLRIIKTNLHLDIPALCRQLQEGFNFCDSTDDDGPSTSYGRSSHNSRGMRSSRRIRDRPFDWLNECKELLQRLWASEDSVPFRKPVDPREHPSYDSIITTPMDLSLIQDKLREQSYANPHDFFKDLRIMFENAKNYTPNKRSKIYAMTVRLSGLTDEGMARILSNYRAYKRYPKPTLASTPVQNTSSPGEEDDFDEDPPYRVGQLLGIGPSPRKSRSRRRGCRRKRVMPARNRGRSTTGDEEDDGGEEDSSEEGEEDSQENENGGEEGESLSEGEDEQSEHFVDNYRPQSTRSRRTGPANRRSKVLRMRPSRKKIPRASANPKNAKKVVPRPRPLTDTEEDEEEEEDSDNGGRRLRKRRPANYSQMFPSESDEGSDNATHRWPKRLRRQGRRSRMSDSSQERRDVSQDGGHSLRQRRIIRHYEEVTSDDEAEGGVNISVSVSSRGRIRKLTAKARASVYRN